jgi:imidazolonepropionase-like amidohydrolase
MNPWMLLSFILVVVFSSHLQAQSVKAITGATLIDVVAGKAVPNSVIVIDGARIVQVGAADQVKIPEGATRIDASGKFVIPGLADMHNHLQTGAFGGPENLKANLARMLAVGVTTVFDPSIGKADFAELKTFAASGPYPHFFGTGPIITVPEDQFGAAVGSPTPKTVAEAQSVIQDLKAAGVDAIKIERDDLSWASSFRLPPMKIEVMEALIKESHAQGLRVFVHAPTLDLAKETLRAGADGLMHGIIDKPVDEEFIDLMQKNRAIYVPTLGLYEDIADVSGWVRRQSGIDQRHLLPAATSDRFSSPPAVAQFNAIFDKGIFTKDHLPTARANVKKVSDAGIPIVLGTDTGFLGVTLGASTQLELSLLVEAGLKPAEALRAATSDAAKMIFREKESGTVEKDHLADLVILDANPLEDIRNVRMIFRVLLGGMVYDPSKM